MRRKDKLVEDQAELVRLLKSVEVCRIAIHDQPYPYLIPVNFGYHDNALYFHSAAVGKKLDLLKQNPHVCFEVEQDLELVKAEKACDWSYRFKSIIGFGKAQILTDADEKQKALEVIMRHYNSSDFAFGEAVLKKVALVRIDIDSMTGKFTND